MYTTTNAIVLSKIRYRDNDLIIKCFTQENGIVSYFYFILFDILQWFFLKHQSTCVDSIQQSSLLFFLLF